MCHGGSDGLAIKIGLKGESSFRFIRKTRRKKEEEEEEEERSFLSLTFSLSLSLSLSLEFWPSIFICFLNWVFGFEFVDLDCVNVEDLIEAFSSEFVELGEWCRYIQRVSEVEIDCDFVRRISERFDPFSQEISTR